MTNKSFLVDYYLNNTALVSGCLASGVLFSGLMTYWYISSKRPLPLNNDVADQVYSLTSRHCPELSQAVSNLKANFNHSGISTRDILPDIGPGILIEPKPLLIKATKFKPPDSTQEIINYLDLTGPDQIHLQTAIHEGARYAQSEIMRALDRIPPDAPLIRTSTTLPPTNTISYSTIHDLDLARRQIFPRGTFPGSNEAPELSNRILSTILDSQRNGTSGGSMQLDPTIPHTVLQELVIFFRREWRDLHGFTRSDVYTYHPLDDFSAGLETQTFVQVPPLYSADLFTAVSEGLRFNLNAVSATRPPIPVDGTQLLTDTVAQVMSLGDRHWATTVTLDEDFNVIGNTTPNLPVQPDILNLANLHQSLSDYDSRIELDGNWSASPSLDPVQAPVGNFILDFLENFYFAVNSIHEPILLVMGLYTIAQPFALALVTVFAFLAINGPYNPSPSIINITNNIDAFVQAAFTFFRNINFYYPPLFAMLRAIEKTLRAIWGYFF